MAKKSRRSPVSRDKRFKNRSASDHGTDERWQHAGRVFEYTETAGVFAVRVAEPHVLDHLLGLRVVDETLRDAGLKLHHDYHIAGIEARVTSSYSSVRGAKGDAEARLLRSEMEEAAYQRWRGALRAIGMPARDIIIHVACFGYAPKVMQLAHLKDGLTELARFYGMRR